MIPKRNGPNRSEKIPVVYLSFAVALSHLTTKSNRLSDVLLSTVDSYVMDSLVFNFDVTADKGGSLLNILSRLYFRPPVNWLGYSSLACIWPLAETIPLDTSRHMLNHGNFPEGFELSPWDLLHKKNHHQL